MNRMVSVPTSDEDTHRRTLIVHGWHSESQVAQWFEKRWHNSPAEYLIQKKSSKGIKYMSKLTTSYDPFGPFLRRILVFFGWNWDIPCHQVWAIERNNLWKMLNVWMSGLNWLVSIQVEQYEPSKKVTNFILYMLMKGRTKRFYKDHEMKTVPCAAHCCADRNVSVWILGKGC